MEDRRGMSLDELTTRTSSSPIFLDDGRLLGRPSSRLSMKTQNLACRPPTLVSTRTADRQVVLGGDGGVRDRAAGSGSPVRYGHERSAEPRFRSFAGA